MAIEARRTPRGCIIEIRDDKSGVLTSQEMQRDRLRRFLVALAQFLVTARSSRLSPLRRQKLLTVTHPDVEIGVDAQGRIQLALAGDRFPSLHFLLDDGRAKRIADALREIVEIPQEMRAHPKKH